MTVAHPIPLRLGIDAQEVVPKWRVTVSLPSQSVSNCSRISAGTVIRPLASSESG